MSLMNDDVLLVDAILDRFQQHMRDIELKVTEAEAAERDVTDAQMVVIRQDRLNLMQEMEELTGKMTDARAKARLRNVLASMQPIEE